MNQLTSHGSGAWQVPATGARVERGVEYGRAEVRELVEDPDHEVRRDQRDVDERESTRRDAV